LVQVKHYSLEKYFIVSKKNLTLINIVHGNMERELKFLYKVLDLLVNHINYVV